MDVLVGRRWLIRCTLGIIAGSSLAIAPNGSSVGAAPPNLRETSHWQFTGTTRCSAGHIEEWWCYYECFGGTCTPVQCEWRLTGRAC